MLEKGMGFDIFDIIEVLGKKEKKFLVIILWLYIFEFYVMADALDHLIKIIGVVHGCLKQMKKRQNIVEYNDFKLLQKKTATV